MFFSIKTNEEAEWNLPYIQYGDQISELTSFDTQKWHSRSGVYYFDQCTAQKMLTVNGHILWDRKLFHNKNRVNIEQRKSILRYNK